MPSYKPSILIVEDNHYIRELLAGILIESGYSVRSAEDGIAALAEILKDIPDLLISDLQMPRMSGFELLAAVGLRFPGIKVIAMSGLFAGDCVPPGVVADAFYSKGNSPSYLLNTVRALGPFRNKQIA
jgi:CheY-like chemotaxis protein